ncbi:efflux transporter transcriptional regulator BcrA [Listeria monocytogenes]
MSAKKQDKRVHLLNAAIELLGSNDFDTLTLEAVAKQANVSKGGLLYHFPSKEALYAGITELIFQDFVYRFNELAENDPIEKGKWTRALIHAYTDDLNNSQVLNIASHSFSKLNPTVTENILVHFEYIQSKIDEDGIDSVLATTIRLTLDGLYYSEFFKLGQVNFDLREKIIEKLIESTT